MIITRILLFIVVAFLIWCSVNNLSFIVRNLAPWSNVFVDLRKGIVVLASIALLVQLLHIL